MKTSRAIALVVCLFSCFFTFYVNNAIAEDAISPSLTALNYTFFLKSCANEDPYHFYEELAENHSALYPIVRLGKPGSYYYELLLEDSDSPILFTSAYDALAYKLWKESALSIGVTQDAFCANADSFLDGSELARIFHTDLLWRPGKQMDTALDSDCDLGGMYTYSPVSKCSSALTRLAKLVSPFQGCLKEPTNSGQSPPAVSWTAGGFYIRIRGASRRFSMKYPGLMTISIVLRKHRGRKVQNLMLVHRFLKIVDECRFHVQ